ncbi:MAG: tetratricopeptide repeat protein, partial [Candidatus Eremiobacterota bacterium]
YPSEAAFRLANLDLREGRARPAAVRYRQSLQRQPDQAVALYNLAVASDRPEEALRLLDQALLKDPPGGYSLARSPGPLPYRVLEMKSDSHLAARAAALRGRLARDERLLQEACERTDRPDPELWLERARLARPEVVPVFLWRYLVDTLEPTRRDSDLCLWGPGTLPGGVRSLTFGVRPDGTVVNAQTRQPLGLTVPDKGHMLSFSPDGTAHVFRLLTPLPVAIGRLKVDGEGRVVPRYRLRTESQEAWQAIRSRPVLHWMLQSPYRSAAERRRPLEDMLADPETALFARWELGTLALQEGTLMEARSHWEACLQKAPEVEQVYYLLATVSLLERRPDRAREVLDRLQERVPGSRMAYQSRLRLALLVKNPYEALAISQVYAERFPADPWPRYAAAEILSEGGRTEPALELARQLVESHPALVEPRYLLATLLGRVGHTSAQIEQLELLLDNDPWPFRAQRMLAANLERMGARDRAMELYREYLASLEALLYEQATYLEVDAHVRRLEGTP